MIYFWYPPPGLFFRLVGLKASAALYANEPDRAIGHTTGRKQPNQYWQLMPGPIPEHAGWYLIKNQATTHLLFSRTHAEPNVGTVVAFGNYPDVYFRMFPGIGARAGYFRLHSWPIERYIFSRFHAEPQIGYRAGDDDDHYFRFDLEDMRFDRIDYKLDAGRILNETPEVLGRQSVRNDTDSAQSSTLHFKKTVLRTARFEHAAGASITVGSTFKTGIPFVAQGEISLEASASYQHRWGEEMSEALEIHVELPVVAPPRSVVVGTAQVTVSDLDVPYVITMRSVSGGVPVESKGQWKGVSFWNVGSEMEQFPLPKGRNGDGDGDGDLG